MPLKGKKNFRTTFHQFNHIVCFISLNLKNDYIKKKMFVKIETLNLFIITNYDNDFSKLFDV